MLLTSLDIFRCSCGTLWATVLNGSETGLKMEVGSPGSCHICLGHYRSLDQANADASTLWAYQTCVK